MPESLSIPSCAWSRRLDETLPTPGVPAIPTSPRFLIQMLPVILRLRRFIKQQTEANFDPLNMMMNAPLPGPHQGVPLGGIGCGSIGRGWRGDFRRWQLRPGFIQHQVVPSDAFSLFLQRPGQPSQATVLSPAPPADGSLSAWQWKMPASCATYHALFPRAWTVYEQPLPGLRLTCRQVSPVIPHNYRESSFPCAVFAWQVENLSDQPATLGLMFTFQNGTGSSNDLAGGHSNEPFQLGQVSGVTLRNIHRQKKSYPLGQKALPSRPFEDPLNFAMAALAGEDRPVTCCTRFQANSAAADLWQDFSQDGKLADHADTSQAAPGQAIGAALVVTLHLPPHGSQEVAFSLAWDMPLVRSGFGTPYYRRYTQFYGTLAGAAPQIARDALIHYPDWEAQIESWQQPILSNPDLPDWYKMALFNELYYLVEGGTLWCYPAGQESSPAPDETGHFAYLEGHEYRMYNTYDVHFYASFALAMLWPKLELGLQRDFARAVQVEDRQMRYMVFTGRNAPRKLRGAVPHDIGWPDEDPWRLVNGYFYHDSNKWKDLNPKFVLQVYRDFHLTGDRAFASEVWSAVQEAMAYVARYDQDGDGLIENASFPDQTYDTWSVSGPSAYTGGLWLASLSAAAALADALGKTEEAAHYRAIYEKGQSSYEKKLWNGRYFNYDSSRSRHHDSIMADQLAGQWYALACGLPPVVAPEQARSALRTVYEYNVQRFQSGKMGAVNGMRPDGSIDRTNLQSQEVWTGTVYAVAAAMLQAGLKEEAFQTAWGIYDVTYRQRGYWFCTPEAWDRKGNYRSLTYMRPLSIWAMQWQLAAG